MSAVTGLADHVRPVADEVATAVEVGQSHNTIGGLKRRVVSVLLVSQRLILQLCHRIGEEDLPAARR
jgi:hypothetical protein